MRTQFKKKSLIFRLNNWYDFLNLNWPPRLQEHTNICKLLWTTVFSVLIGWPIIFPIEVAATVITVAIVGTVLIVFAPTLFLLGQRMSFKDNDVNLVPIKKMLPTIRGHKIYPIYPLIFAATIFIIAENLPTLILCAKWIGIALLVFLVLLAICIAVSAIRKSDTYNAIGAYLAAKKKRFCIDVEFVD